MVFVLTGIFLKRSNLGFGKMTPKMMKLIELSRKTTSLREFESFASLCMFLIRHNWAMRASEKTLEGNVKSAGQ